MMNRQLTVPFATSGERRTNRWYGSSVAACISVLGRAAPLNQPRDWGRVGGLALAAGLSAAVWIGIGIGFAWLVR